MNLIDPLIVLEKKEGVVEIKNYVNKIKIVKELYTGGSNTASNIGQSVGISLPTVNLLLTDLLEEQLVVKEGRGQSQGGRKPDLYGLAGESFYVLAIDLNRFSARVAIFNTKNERVSKIHNKQIPLNNDPKTIDTIFDFPITSLKIPGLLLIKSLPLGSQCLD